MVSILSLRDKLVEAKLPPWESFQAGYGCRISPQWHHGSLSERYHQARSKYINMFEYIDMWKGSGAGLSRRLAVYVLLSNGISYK